LVEETLDLSATSKTKAKSYTQTTPDRIVVPIAAQPLVLTFEKHVGVKMKATAAATWTGTWKAGNGTISTMSDIVRGAPYSFSSRFEGTPGASPEEFLAAAYAGCFNQAIANNFGMKDLQAESVETTAEVDLGYGDDGHPAIKGIHVKVTAKVPGATEEVFQYCAGRAKTNCTIAKQLKCEITMEAKLIA
jgi:osmotically inducible protein OsmC